ncbi:MAG: ABC transporter permease [Acidobacteriota bacterium]
MRLLGAMFRYELALQRRSPRFRLAVLAYVGLGSVPAGLLYFILRHHTSETLGANSYLAQTLQVQPYLTALLTVMIAGNRSSVAALTEMWSVLSSAALSNTGFVVRRWLALLMLILPFTLLPLLVSLAFAVAAGHTSIDPVTWIGSWAIRILPLAAALSAYWLAFVTITGGELAALITTFAILPMLISVANQFLLRYHLTVSGYSSWFGYWDLFMWIRWTLASWGDAERHRYAPGFAATAAPFDLAMAGSWLIGGVLLCGFAGLGLGLATAFVRRTRRDLRPRPVPPNHQLRTFLHKLNRQREIYAYDGALGLRERLAILLGVLTLGLFVGWWLYQQEHFQHLGMERHRIETAAEFSPLPLTVSPGTWRVAGRIDPRGGLVAEVDATLQNQGSGPQLQLPFTLNQALEVSGVSAGARQVTAQRAWDRLLLTLDPPLAPGETVDLKFELAGTPSEIQFYFGRRSGGAPFAWKFEAAMNARFPRDVRDFSRSQVRRAISGRRIDLRASDLTPVPRYTSWTLTRPDEGGGSESGVSDYGREVPIEVQSIPVDLELDLSLPSKWLLADTCGHISRHEGEQARLRGSCRTSLTELRLAGGRLVALEPGDAAVSVPMDGLGAAGASKMPGSPATGPNTPGKVVIAALPAHRELARERLGALARVAALSDRAWPGLPGLDDLVVLEWPPAFFLDLSSGMRRRFGEQGSDLHGQLLLVHEREMIATTPFEAEDLVAQLLSRDLIARRELEPEQELLFRQFFRSLMVRRMGLDKGGGAAVSAKPWVQQALKKPILEATLRNRYIWRLRLPALLVELESRVGGEQFYAGIESFLAADSEQPGTFEELLAELERRSGVSLQRTYEDHFQGQALPLLRLEDVSAVRRDRQWLIEGKLRNTGTVEANCPLIIKTELSEMRLMVTVDSETATTFSVRSSVRPHTVLLDPEKTCYRFLLKTSPALERANLLN